MSSWPQGLHPVRGVTDLFVHTATVPLKLNTMEVNGVTNYTPQKKPFASSFPNCSRHESQRKTNDSLTSFLLLSLTRAGNE